MHDISLSLDQKQTLMENLGVLLKAGIPLTQALESLAIEGNKKQNKLLHQTAISVTKGNSLSETWLQYPHLFDRVSMHLLKAAEESGTLVETLQHLAQHFKQRKELREKIISALIYPSIIAFICLGVIGVIFFVIIPRIEKIFAELRVTIPWSTQLIIDTSHLLRSQPLLSSVIATVIIILVIVTFKMYSQSFFKLLSKLPVIAPTLRAVDLAYSMRTLGTLLRSGVPIQESLLLTSDIVRTPTMKKLFLSASENVIQGKSFSTTVKQFSNTIPSSQRIIIEAGEQSGTLEQACINIADRADAQLEIILKRATTIVEPVLLLTMGLIVAITMLSVLSPIYQLIGGISG